MVNTLMRWIGSMVFTRVLFVLCLPACNPQFGYPYLASQLQLDALRYPPHLALVHYLKQSNADPQVCNPKHQPSVKNIEPRVLNLILKAGRQRKIPITHVYSCTSFILDHVPPTLLEGYLRVVSVNYGKVLRSKPLDIETADAFRDLLLYSPQYPNQPQALRNATRKLFVRMKADVAGRDDRRKAQQFHLQGLFETLELDDNHWQGQPVTASVIQHLSNSDTLSIFRARLSDPELKRESKYEQIRRSIQASSYPNLQAQSNTVLKSMLRWGQNRVNRAQYPLGTIYFDII